MSSVAAFANIASLLGDPSRAAMLAALMDRRALLACCRARDRVRRADGSRALVVTPGGRRALEAGFGPGLMG